MPDERRRAWRFPVLEEHQSAELRVGDASLAVRLVDQSATGFSILLEQHPGVYAGEVVWLQTSTGWTEVRVVKIRQEVDGTRIGLERLAEASTKPAKVSAMMGDRLSQESPASGLLPLIFMAVMLSGVIGFLAWTAFVRRVDGDYVVVIGRSEEADNRPAAVKALEGAAIRRQTEMQKTIREFGAALLAVPDVGAHLKLSPEQAEKLAAIVAATARTENELRSSGKPDVAGQIADLRAVATTELLEVLNASQRIEWQATYEAAIQSLDQRQQAASKAPE